MTDYECNVSWLTTWYRNEGKWNVFCIAKYDSAATLADTNLSSSPSVTPRQIAENTQAYRILHAEGPHYPFCIIPTPGYKPLLHQQKTVKAKLEQTHLSWSGEKAERGLMFAEKAHSAGHPTSSVCILSPKILTGCSEDIQIALISSPVNYKLFWAEFLQSEQSLS